ncbi:MAG: hypothetical protein B6A08_15880 [Sorangiineae bacterium NIC37A_2]|jgi:chemotaxis protein MotB|nr:MAG: hypothetical protein B6A08_15880 [Sorangiineae bacterium NIC37A_2]
MRGVAETIRPLLGLSAFIFFGCGYSQEELDQHIRTAESLRSDLATERALRKKAEADYADALEELENVRRDGEQKALSLSTAQADLETQQRAIAEYAARLEQLEQMRIRFEALREKLVGMTSLGLKVVVRDNRIIIQLPGDVLFDSGSDRLRKEGQEIVLSVAKILKNDPDLMKRQFQVAGHTDNRPFKGGMFQDNWGLSAMRARSVVELLVRSEEEGGGGLPAANWSAAGYGSEDPVADNSTEEGRAKNRRVELVAEPDVREMLDLKTIGD